jgi:hypothetical protein
MECDFARHDWASDSNSGPRYQAALFKCRECGVCHLMELRFTAENQVHTRLRVLPAGGGATISRKVLRFFLTMWEDTCGRLEADGFQVTRAEPEIDAEPVGR